MSGWSIAVLALMVGGVAPAAFLASRGSPLQRLVGLELTSAVAVVVLILLVQISGQSDYLVVPLVLVVLSFAGTLVYTRLLHPRG